VIPLKLSRDELTDGYIELMRDVYSPEAYFQRVDDLFLKDDFQFGLPRAKYWRTHPWRGMKSQALNLLRFAGISWRLMRQVTDKSLKAEYRRRIVGLLKSRRDPAVLFTYAVKCATHYHHHRMATEMSRQESSVVNTF
jgi:hypothetical protein